MLRTVCCIVAFSALTASPLFAQASPPDRLSDADRDVVRTMLDVPLVRSGLPADSLVLLDSTSPMCDGPGGRGCVGPTLLDVASWPISQECGRTDVAALRTAFVARNVETWRLGAVQTTLPSASGSEIRMLSPEALRERFPDGWFLEVSAPAYSPDGQFTLIVAHGMSAARLGRRVAAQVFERTGTGWTPIRCSFYAR